MISWTYSLFRLKHGRISGAQWVREPRQGDFQLFQKSKLHIKEWQHNPQQLYNQILEQRLFLWILYHFRLSFHFGRNPLSILKLCKKWVWNTFESIFFPFYKHFIIMQYSLGQKRPQQIYMTLCSNLHSIPELCLI